MFLFSLMGAMLVGGLTGYAVAWLGLVRYGWAVAVILGIGGGVVAWLVSALTGIGFGGRTMTAIVGAAVALFLAPVLGRR